ncbi:MAG: ribonuclease HI [Rickettsiales bacterium]|jgi:ribonuclease HI|nr:ribonuclease HI [Rickettsiales bacterium]
MKEITIYTDGACSKNPGPGGWGALLIYNGSRKSISGGEAETTNNRMEIMAALKALKHLKVPCKGKLYTDSKYLQQGVTEWMDNWKKNNWRGNGKTPIKNLDLWQDLDIELKKHKIEFHWVKAHNGHPENEFVDELARLACEEYKI